MSPGLEVERQIGLAMLDALQKLDITVNVTAVPWPTLVARGLKAETAPSMIAVYVTPVSTDPGRRRLAIHVLGRRQLLGDAPSARPGTRQDGRRRAHRARPGQAEDAYAAIQDRIVADQPAIFGMVEDRRWAMRDYVQGFAFCPVRLTGEVDFYPMWIEAS